VDETLAVRLAAAMMVLGAGYVVLGPLFVKGMAVHRARQEARRNGQ